MRKKEQKSFSFYWVIMYTILYDTIMLSRVARLLLGSFLP